MTARLRASFPKGRGQATVRARSDLCEACGARPGTEFSHRIAASRGGTWAPSNGVRACRRCHDWFEAEMLLAPGGGWHVRRDPRPAVEVPVFLVTPEARLGGWVLLDDEGGREAVDPDDYGLPEVPVHLPPGHVRLAWLLANPSMGRPLETVPWVDPR